jgi:hypothetical protein
VLDGCDDADDNGQDGSVVGRWERVNECPQLLKALSEAGLGALAAPSPEWLATTAVVGGSVEMSAAKPPK